MREPDGKDTSVLVIAGFGSWMNGTLRTEKIRTHVHPMADAADHVTYLTASAVPVGESRIDYRRISPSSVRMFDYFRLCIAAIHMARSGEYDLIASFSLVPYGIFALLAKWASGNPAHLGIIGMDLDVHAQGSAKHIVRWLFRRFDAITIAGSAYRNQLLEMGVESTHIHTVLHPVRSDFSPEEPTSNSRYDLLWIGRMSQEKDPERFVSIVQSVQEVCPNVTAVMVGDGPLFDRISEKINDEGLRDVIHLAGWQENPAMYYRASKLTILTSEREMLPLTVIESMLVGTPVVAPPIGALPDILVHNENGYLVDNRDEESYAAVIHEALNENELRSRIGARATSIQSMVSTEAIVDSWRNVFNKMLNHSIIAD